MQKPTIPASMMVVVLAHLLTLTVIAQEPNVEMRYPLGPESLQQDSVPRGTVSNHVWRTSKVFPGTIRRYHVYVPSQYDGKTPLALMVFQDGHTYLKEDGDFRVPTVFDNLIHQGSIPPMVGVALMLFAV